MKEGSELAHLTKKYPFEEFGIQDPPPPTEEMKEESPKYRSNPIFLGLVMLIFLCHSIHTSYVVKATFRLYDFMEVRFGWTHDPNSDLYKGLWA